jgi:methylmalonyl-CoA mutase
MTSKSFEFNASNLEAWQKAAVKSAPGGDVNAPSTRTA